MVPSTLLVHGQTSLRATPRTRERTTVNIEFWFSEAAGKDSATGVGHLLQRGFGGKVVVNLNTQRIVLSAGELVCDNLEYKGRVADPTVKVVRIVGIWTGNHNSSLKEDYWRYHAGVVRRTLAPDDLVPFGPMFARRPALAIGDSVLKYEVALAG